jgi:hypothetical protein
MLYLYWPVPPPYVQILATHQNIQSNNEERLFHLKEWSFHNIQQEQGDQGWFTFRAEPALNITTEWIEAHQTFTYTSATMHVASFNWRYGSLFTN